MSKEKTSWEKSELGKSAAPVGPSGSSLDLPVADISATKELRRLNRALRALSACNQALAQASSEQQLLDEICDVIVRLGAYRFAWIGYAEPGEARKVRPMAHAGHEDGYLKEITVAWSDAPVGRGPVGLAIRENKAFVVANTAHDSTFAPWRDPALQRGYAALIALPLRVAGMPFGALAIYSDQPDSFEANEVELLAEMASNLEFGITAIRAQEEGRRATTALREAEAKYRQLVEMVPAISYVSIVGALGPFLYISPQVKTILGYEPQECLADHRFWWDHLNPEDHATALKEDDWNEGTLYRVEYRMRARDGREVWLRDEAVIVFDPQTGERLMRGLLVDVTDRKRAELALQRSEENYRMFVAQSSEGIFRTEHEPPVPTHLPVEEQIALSLASSRIAECNDAMARMYGLGSAAELQGKRVSELLIADDPVNHEFLGDFIRSGYRVTDKESHEFDSQRRLKIFRNTIVGIVEHGHLVRTWGIQRDITESRRLEEQLRNAQQMEAIGRLAGGVAHDFNNILSIIMGHGELLLAAPGLGDRARNGVDQIRRAADRAASLTQQLLAFSRKQVLQPKVLDLNACVSDVQKMLSRVIGEDIELVASLHPSLAWVKADPGQVEQVLMNLAVNARDAMPHGGRLAMETANLNLTPELARQLDLAPGHYVALAVSDTGHGMDSATLAHIFEPFFTTKAIGKGTGLGLATLYGIVKQSGGGIFVESAVQQGTCFRIYLPAAEHETPKPPASSEQRVAGGSETILLAEDEPGLRELTRIFLESYGYKVLEAAGAHQAIQSAEIFSGPIHLLLTDVIMPGISGPQLADKILASRPHTKVVYMTGYTDDMVVQHRVLEPGVELLQKPFTKLDLAQKVRSTLDGST